MCNQLKGLFEEPEPLSWIPKHQVSPLESKLKEWRAIQEILISMEWKKCLKEKTANLMQLITSPGSFLDFSKATMNHEFPDQRAKNTVQSHFILWIQFSFTGNTASLFADVHASCRSSTIHHVYIELSNLVDAKFCQNSLLTCECSCESGYDFCFNYLFTI